MKKYVCLLTLIIMISIVGCESALEQPGTITPATTPTQPIRFQPVFTHWEMVGNPSFSQNDFTLDINGFVLMNQRIVIFYSLSGFNSNQLASNEIFQIIDDYGSISELTKVIPLSKVDQVEVGLMVFEPRRIGVHDLNLVMTAKSDPNVIQKTMVAHINGSVSDDFFDREFSGAPLKSSELSGYQISILWSPPPENKSDGASSNNPAATSTPILSIYPTQSAPVIEASIPLPPGVILQDEISFNFENIGTKQIQYVGVQLLSDGNAISVSNDVSVLATPIVLVTPYPQPLSSTQYPPPPTSYP